MFLRNKGRNEVERSRRGGSFHSSAPFTQWSLAVHFKALDTILMYRERFAFHIIICWLCLKAFKQAAVFSSALSSCRTLHNNYSAPEKHTQGYSPEEAVKTENRCKRYCRTFHPVDKANHICPAVWGLLKSSFSPLSETRAVFSSHFTNGC